MVVEYKGWKYPTDNQPISYADEQGDMWYRIDCRYQILDDKKHTLFLLKYA